MEQNLVGILMNAAVHRGIPHGATGQESLHNYEEAAAAFGLVPCYLKLADIDIPSRTCRAYIRRRGGYRREELPLPAVIHNRAIYGPDSRGTEALAAAGSVVFNRNTRRGKDEIHRLLADVPALRRHLPDTETGLPGLRRLMLRCGDIILKPCRGSVGEGVMRLTRKGSGWVWTYRPAGSRRLSQIGFNEERLPQRLAARLGAVPYLAQERIPLAEADGSPFDLRVTVQKGWGGEWGVTGLFAKLAPPGSFISNVARGGSALPSSRLLDRVFPGPLAAHLRMSAGALALEIARALEPRLPGLADLGLDLGIDRNGQLFFIECNGRDQRYGFLKAGLPEVWKESYRRPMGYARYLLEQRQP
ncbi:YheC/YheD family protein [Paenibacillus spiritus]|uniref:YheC/YheD family protein n=1 Tax=Paenibacillus spiritus TaxID=2496557 RepID=A0A5J5GK45_9BACL|nr:YheC/YheD family protein [Paenibacillus spiritus]KAA9008565.1 YheC/YheD family protein [Paenibacillus spiritus]